MKKKPEEISDREIEKRYLADSVKTTSRGQNYMAGEKIIVADQPEPLQMCKLARARVEWVSYFIIGLFGAMYIIGVPLWILFGDP